MKKNILFLIVTSCSFNGKAQDVFLNPDKIYQFKAIFIDSKGDTITKEKMMMQATGHRWWIQPRIQHSYKISYFPDTIGLKKFVHFDPYQQERREKYFSENGFVMLKRHNREITGGEETQFHFFMHPPRQNQYKYTQLAPFPQVYKYVLSRDSVTTFDAGLVWGNISRFKYHYILTPIEDTTISNSINGPCWQVNAVSTSDKYGKNYFDAIYSTTNGFLEWKYRFFDGTRIEIELEKIDWQ